MDRLNLTLDPGTSSALAKHARREGKPRAAVARELIQEDVRELLDEIEGAQLDLLGDE